MFPLIYGGDAPNTASGFNSSISRYQNMNSHATFLNSFIIFCFERQNLINSFSYVLFRYCFRNSLNKHLVKGKIVLCESILDPNDVEFLSGAVGMIHGAIVPKDLPNAYAVPASFLSLRNFRLVLSYFSSTGYRSSCTYLYNLTFILSSKSYLSFNHV